MRGSEVALVPEPAAAVGALSARERLRAVKGGHRLFVTRLEGRPHDERISHAAATRPPGPGPSIPVSEPVGAGPRPTHVLLGNRARAVTEEPLVVGTAPPQGARGFRLAGETAGVSRAHCRLFEVGGEVVVEDLSTYGTFVNGEPVAGRAVLVPGDRVRVGSPGQELLIIAVED
jgi:hypothetical protein